MTKTKKDPMVPLLAATKPASNDRSTEQAGGVERIFELIDPNMSFSNAVAVMVLVIPDRADEDLYVAYEERHIAYEEMCSRQIGVFLTLYLLTNQEKRLLPPIRKLLRAGWAKMQNLFEKAETSSEYEGRYRWLGQTLSQMYKDDPRRFRRCFCVLQRTFNCFNHDSVSS